MTNILRNYSDCNCHIYILQGRNNKPDLEIPMELSTSTINIVQLPETFEMEFDPKGLNLLDNTIIHSKYLLKYFAIITQNIVSSDFYDNRSDIWALVDYNIVTRSFSGLHEELTIKFDIYQEFYIIYLTQINHKSLRINWMDFTTAGQRRYSVVIMFLANKQIIPICSYYQYCRISKNVNVDNIINFEEFIKSIVIIKWRISTPANQPYSPNLGLLEIRRISKLNPFLKLEVPFSNYYSTVHLSTVINESLYFCTSTTQGPCDFSDSDGSGVITHGNYEHFSKYWHPNPCLFMVMDEGLAVKFIYCYKELNLSFQMYVEPFQYEVWIAIIITVLISSLICHIYVRTIQNHDCPKPHRRECSNSVYNLGCNSGNSILHLGTLCKCAQKVWK